jgi:hypothetical protein
MFAGRWSALVATAPPGDPLGISSTSKPQQTTAARGRFAYERHWPAIAYSRVGTGRTPSAVPSSSNFPASHLGWSSVGLVSLVERFSSPSQWPTYTIASAPQ